MRCYANSIEYIYVSSLALAPASPTTVCFNALWFGSRLVAVQLRIPPGNPVQEIRCKGNAVPGKYAPELTKCAVDTLSVDGTNAVFRDRDLPGFSVRVYRTGRKVLGV